MPRLHGRRHVVLMQLVLLHVHCTVRRPLLGLLLHEVPAASAGTEGSGEPVGLHTQSGCPPGSQASCGTAAQLPGPHLQASAAVHAFRLDPGASCMPCMLPQLRRR